MLKEFRSRPIALYLMVAAYDYLQASGVAGMFVWAMAEKTRVLDLYAKFGFKVHGETFMCCARKPATAFFLNLSEDAIYDTEKLRIHEQISRNYRRYLVDAEDICL